LIVIETVSEFDYRFECKVQETTAVAGVLRYMGPARAHLAP
jgi:hypothetical protein